MTRAEAFSVVTSICGGPGAPHYVCPHDCQPVASTRISFRFLLLHGRWAACDRCDRGPRTPPVSTINVHKLCVAVLQVSGIRRTANLIVGMFVAEVACRRTVDVWFSRGSRCSRAAVSVTQMGKSWRCSHEMRSFDERMTMR